MEVIWFAEQGLSLALGFGGGMAYQQYRLWKIKRNAPSAKVVVFHVSLTQQDYDCLTKKEADVEYLIVDRKDAEKEPPSSPRPAR